MMFFVSLQRETFVVFIGFLDGIDPMCLYPTGKGQ